MIRAEDPQNDALYLEVGRLNAEWSGVELAMGFFLGWLLSPKIDVETVRAIMVRVPFESQVGLIQEIVPRSNRVEATLRPRVNKLLARVGDRRRERNDVIHSIFVPGAPSEGLRFTKDAGLKQYTPELVREVRERIIQLALEIHEVTSAVLVAK